ncbi:MULTISPECIES: transcription antitermination factor NusB [Peptoniphilus]|uniref:transcription antitermination factor NusB n=1 Tax=Peptoniphilus TaxID=162289 RepID=UPI0001DA9AEB|nr:MULTISPECIES: transcription antitermination factor NusB [Peptoniphilus]EFI42053.1 transcription antitermination factor NusB [Peptoniphilus sp. oral taxon 386 str. F0131]
MSRKKARIGQMQVLYQMDITDDFSSDGLNTFLENFEFSEEEKDYINSTIPEIIKNLENIDQTIQSHLEGWSLNRLAKVDKEVLRIAIYEILYRDDIPEEVSINEAVEISKQFGSSESSKFINGILGSIYRSMHVENQREQQ